MQTIQAFSDRLLFCWGFLRVWVCCFGAGRWLTDPLVIRLWAFRSHTWLSFFNVMSSIFHITHKMSTSSSTYHTREEQRCSNSLETLLHNLESFFLKVYEQTVTVRSNRTISCYKHLKIAPDSESYQKKPNQPCTCLQLTKVLLLFCFCLF